MVGGWGREGGSGQGKVDVKGGGRRKHWLGRDEEVTVKVPRGRRSESNRGGGEDVRGGEGWIKKRRTSGD